MIGIDTNVLVRLVTGDDAGQSAVARRYLAEHSSLDEPAFVNRVALVELVWVLETAYDEYGRTEIAAVLDGILETGQFAVEDAVAMRGAVARYRGGAEFSDAAIEATSMSRGCTVTITFDRRASRKLSTFRLIA